MQETQETRVQPLGWEDPLEEDMATHSSILASLIAQSVKVIRVQSRRPGFNSWVRKIPWRGNGNSLQYFCLENPMEEEPGGLQSMGLQTVRHN